MTTYGQFYNPKGPDHRKAIALIAMAVFILLAWLLSGCNSVKKSTDIHIGKLDSSSSAKVDSLATEKRDLKVDSSGVKQWERETVIEYFDNSIYRDDSTIYAGNHLIYRPSEYSDGRVKVQTGQIRKITIRSKGKDSTVVKLLDQGEKAVDLKKASEAELTKFDKTKNVKKQSTRSSPVIWIVAGFVAIGALSLFIIYKRIK